MVDQGNGTAGTVDVAEEVLDLAGHVQAPSITGLPSGYVYGVTRYADVILKSSFASRFPELIRSLEQFRPRRAELVAGGGGRTEFVRRFDNSLSAQLVDRMEVWGKANITVEKRIGLDGTTELVSRVRGHEIDMFGRGSHDSPFPGVAVEMEWNNKDPFFDRDLLNFQALHHEGAIAVGVIVTRGPSLQRLISKVIPGSGGKYGSSTTHWDKLIPRVNLGGGGECPLLLVGIEPPRIQGVALLEEVLAEVEAADDLVRRWREIGFESRLEAKQQADRLKTAAIARLSD